MSRTTIDFGIDLGTTNSAIAVLEGVTPRIIKNNVDQDITPSAVYIDKKQVSHVGSRGKQAIIDKPQDAYCEFKRRMGGEWLYEFKAAGLKRSPEELSAEILRALKDDVKRQLDEDIDSAVITVPAAFELNQCDATTKAADLAGLKSCRMIQEPVAAALAYGFQVDCEKTHWLVYDFGGGTFDAAIIQANEGMLNVINHGGNNFLGGSDIDWALIDKLLAPELQSNFNLPDFERANAKWKAEFRQLKHAIEVAKIDVTSKDRTTLNFRFTDLDGTEIDGDDITISRAQLISIAEPIIQRSIDICQRVLSDQKMSPSAIDKIILVGGPTKAAYFREILQDQLGISIDASVDPMTVVAQGAAIFAGTQQNEQKHRPAPTKEAYQLNLKYEPVGSDTEPSAVGKVTSPGTDNFDGYTVEFSNDHSKWRSGKIPLSEDGVFIADLVAEKGMRNLFIIELFAPSGVRQQLHPNSMVYTVGSAFEEQPLIHSMGIELAGNEYRILAEKGGGLPIKTKRANLRTIAAIASGTRQVALRIPIIEGDNKNAADRNKLIGAFELTGENIERDIPAGSEVELHFEIDESRILKVYVYLPLLDETFQLRFDLRKKNISHKELSRDWNQQQDRLNDISSKIAEAGLNNFANDLKNLKRSYAYTELPETIAAATTDPDSASKAEALLLDLKQEIDKIEDHVMVPTLKQKFNLYFEQAKPMIQGHGKSIQREQFNNLREKALEAEKSKDSIRLQRLIKDLVNLYFEIAVTQPEFWVGQFQMLIERKHETTNIDKARQLEQMGHQFLEEGNLGGLSSVVNQFYAILPQEVADAIQRGYGSTVR